MSKKTTFIILLLLVFLLSSLTMAQINDDPKETLVKLEQAIYPENVTYVAKMTIQRPKKVYEKKIKIFLQGNEKALVEFLEPPQERGLRVLRVNEDMWMFLPSVEKVIRLSGKMSVTGGDFMYDDMLRVKYTADYIPVSLSPTTEEQQLLHIEARHDKAPYKAINIIFDPKRSLPVAQEFYVSSGILLKKLTYRQIKSFEGKLVPSQWVMELADSTDYKTTLDVLDYTTVYEINDRIFTREYLKKGM